MPHVASEPNIVPARLQGFDPRSRAADAKDSPSSFALLVETPQSPPPTQRDRGNRVQADRASRAQDTSPSRNDQTRRNDQAPDRPRASDKADNPAPGAEKSADAKAPAAGEAATENTAAEADNDAETVATDTFEAGVVAAAIGDGAAVPPEQSPIVAPVVIQAALAAQVGGNGSPDGADDIAAASGKSGQAAGAPASEPETPELPGVPAPDTPDTPDIQAAPKGRTDQAAARAQSDTDGQPVDADKFAAEIAAIATAESDEDRASAATGKIVTPEPAGKEISATAPEAGKHRASTELRAANAGERTKEAGTDATEENDRNSAPAAPDEARPVHTRKPAHERADAPAPTEPSSQPLGAQVSEAARGAKPPSEAVHAILQSNDRPAGLAAQANATQTTSETAVPIAGLAVEIAARARAGRNHFEIRLDPPELGRIDVRLDIDRSGQVHSRLMVERAETLEYLRRDVAELERALQQAGLKTGDNGLQFALRDQGFAGRNDSNDSPRTGHLVVPDHELPPADTLRSGYSRMWRASGGIDIRV